MKTSLPHARHQLSDDEIRSRFGSIFGAGIAAFKTDVDYLEAIVLEAVRRRDRAEKRVREAEVEERRIRRLEARLRRFRPRSPAAVVRRDAEVYRCRQQGLDKRDTLTRLGITVDDYKNSTRRLKAAGLPLEDRRVGAVVRDQAVNFRRRGLTYSEIGQRMGLSEATVRHHLRER